MVSLQKILGYYKQYWKVAIGMIAVSCLLEVSDLLVPYAIGQILNVLSGQPIDRLGQILINFVENLLPGLSEPSLSLGSLLGLVLLVTVIKAPLQPWLTSWFHWEISLRARRDRYQEVVAKILTLPLSFYDENNPGRVAGKISRGIENHTWTYPEIAGQMIPKLGRVLGIFGVILLIDRGIAIAFLASFSFILIHTVIQTKKLIKQEILLDSYHENTESRTSELITNIKTVKAFATEDQELQQQEKRFNREYQVVTYRIHKGYVKLQTWTRTTVQTSVFLILLFSLVATVRGNISLGHFVTTLTVSSMAYAELEPIGLLIEVFARRYASFEGFAEFMELPQGQDAVNLAVSCEAYQFTGKLDIQGLDFGYSRDRPVLQNINLLIEPYQTVALVGRSGSGKSTLIKLLLRYFEPDRGKILIDGVDIRTLEVTGYRRRLAIVHQDVDIFNGTVLDNLTYGNPNASLEQVTTACEIAKVTEFIDQLPRGYQTTVGERGVRLSGGQKQRLGIARALIMDPDILIFDEATSSLDYESERAIQQAMTSIMGTRTTIVIAHRLSTIREADKIVVLDNGSIAEIGSHTELLEHAGIYHRLHLLGSRAEIS